MGLNMAFTSDFLAVEEKGQKGQPFDRDSLSKVKMAGSAYSDNFVRGESGTTVWRSYCLSRNTCSLTG